MVGIGRVGGKKHSKKKKDLVLKARWILVYLKNRPKDQYRWNVVNEEKSSTRQRQGRSQGPEHAEFKQGVNHVIYIRTIFF